MRRFFMFCFLGFFAVSLASAQDWAKARLDKSPRHQEWVKVVHGGRTVQCFVVYPEVSGKAPAVLVIHEIFGLTDWARDACDQLAAAGYIAIAPASCPFGVTIEDKPGAPLPTHAHALRRARRSAAPDVPRDRRAPAAT